MNFSKIDLERHSYVAREILIEAIQSDVSDRRKFQKLSNRIVKRNHSKTFHNLYFVKAYRSMIESGEVKEDPAIWKLIQKRSVRTMSGVAPVTVMMKAWPCPGQCVYCPTDVRMPKSYIPSQPAAARAFRQKFDPYKQMVVRLQALEATGHEVSKVELRVIGGTWSSYPVTYQRWFLFRCLEVMNGWEQISRGIMQKLTQKNTEALSVLDSGELMGDDSFLEREVSEEEYREAVRINETASVRCIGINIETRPDNITVSEVKMLREFGVTKIEMGVQTTSDAVQELTLRGHDLKEVKRATRLLKNAGFKISYHMMPNLPGSTPEKDVEDYRVLFADECYQPDYLKIYPCMVMPKTILDKWYQKGEFKCYDDATLVDILCRAKSLVPEYVRIDRVLRDIPSGDLVAGTPMSNMRQVLESSMKAMGLRCRCIRCREIGHLESASVDQNVVLREYSASGGVEVFVSVEDSRLDKIIGLARLRLSQRSQSVYGAQQVDGISIECGTDDVEQLYHAIPVLRGSALLREIHVYGQQLEVDKLSSGQHQHVGTGKKLMKEVERIAFDRGFRRIAVIAGIGTREYYRKLGYELEGTYMVKELVG